MSDRTSMSPPEAVLNALAGFWTGRALYAVAKLGIADLVKGGPKSVEELASGTGSDAGALYRLLRALASTGWFEEDPDGRFGPSPWTAALETESPVSLRYLAMTELGEEHYPAWGNLLHSVRTGEIAFNDHFGIPNWEYWSQHPEQADIFNKAMSNLTTLIDPALIANYDFRPFRKIVDVGGGRGTLLASILRHTDASGIVLDLPHVIALARQDEATAALGNRCELVEGDGQPLRARGRRFLQERAGGRRCLHTQVDRSRLERRAVHHVPWQLPECDVVDEQAAGDRGRAAGPE